MLITSVNLHLKCKAGFVESFEVTEAFEEHASEPILERFGIEKEVFTVIWHGHRDVWRSIRSAPQFLITNDGYQQVAF